MKNLRVQYPSENKYFHPAIFQNLPALNEALDMDIWIIAHERSTKAGRPDFFGVDKLTQMDIGIEVQMGESDERHFENVVKYTDELADTFIWIAETFRMKHIEQIIEYNKKSFFKKKFIIPVIVKSLGTDNLIFIKIFDCPHKCPTIKTALPNRIPTASTTSKMEKVVHSEYSIKPLRAILNSSSQIILSNEFIHICQNLTLQERRLVYAVASLIEPGDTSFKTYDIRVMDLASLFHINSQDFYKSMKEAVETLNTKELLVHNTGQVQKSIPWVQKAEYQEGKGFIRIRLSSELERYLLNLKSYTTLLLKNVTSLKSEYSWRLYEIFKTVERQHFYPLSEPHTAFCILTIEQIRQLLNIKRDKLTLIKNLREVVLERAKHEITNKTDITFTYQVYEKFGRNIHSFIFYISPNANCIEDAGEPSYFKKIFNENYL